MLSFYPAIKPYQTHELAVDEIHTLYVEECGNPDGRPIIFLHGGPGGGFSEDDRRFFDPEKFRIVLLCQRGACQSTPRAELRNNTTEYLISDIEKIRNHLAIDQWIVFGGSWGSTLSLVYAQQHPENVLGLILRGIFLGREKDISWLYHPDGGAARMFPDAWEDFVAPVADAKPDTILQNYYQLLTGKDEISRMAAAKAWATWEAKIATLEPNQTLLKHFTDPLIALGMARISCHYFVNKCFLRPKQILENMNKIANIPGVIVHGRYDALCPVENAWKLSKAWPNAELNIIRDAGHTASEPAITDALIHATHHIENRIKNNR